MQAKLQGIEGRMAHVAQLANRLSLRFDVELAKTKPERVVAAMEIAARGVEPLVRKIILRHYQQSGLGTHTKDKSYNHSGWLRSAINRINVTLAVRTFKSLSKVIPTLRISFPSNMNHVAAASLNYGSVHVPRTTREVYDLSNKKLMGVKSRAVVGRAGKRSLKKFAYKGKLSKRARGRIESGSVFQGQRQSPGVQIHKAPTGTRGKKSIEVGQNLKVRVPFPFFFFTQQEIGAIAFGFNSLFRKELGYAS